MFHSYVSLPEGIPTKNGDFMGENDGDVVGFHHENPDLMAILAVDWDVVNPKKPSNGPQVCCFRFTP